jgi:hypothetical protein
MQLLEALKRTDAEAFVFPLSAISLSLVANCYKRAFRQK